MPSPDHQQRLTSSLGDCTSELKTPGGDLALDPLIFDSRRHRQVQEEMMTSQALILSYNQAVVEARGPLVERLLAEDVQLARRYATSCTAHRHYTAELLEHLEGELSEHRSGILRTDSYLQAKHELAALEDCVRRAVVERNSSVEYVRQAVRERQEKASILARCAEQLTSRRCVILPAVRHGPTGGVAGIALTLAHALTKIVPNATVCLAESCDELGAMGMRHSLSKTTHSPSIIHSGLITELDCVVAVTPQLGAYTHKHDIEVPPFGQICGIGTSPSVPYARIPSVSPKTLFPRVSFDSADPRGSALVEPRMQVWRAERDAWSLSEWKVARLKWLADELSAHQRDTLYSLASREGWSAEGCAWGMAYVQEDRALFEELKLVVKQQAQLQAQGVDHVLIHLRPGVCLKTPLLAPPRVRLLNKDGSLMAGGGAQSDPPFVTLVIHDTLPHHSFLRGLAQMVGVPRRIETLSAWTDFPTWVTGTASWTEAVSAGAIALHDGVDWRFDKLPQIRAALIKHCIVTSRNNDTAWEDHSAKADSLVPSFVLGHADHQERYANLATWSLLARSFSQSMRYFDSAVDIAWCLVQ